MGLLVDEPRESRIKLKAPEYLSIFYHNLFDYPLTKTELEKWQTNRDLRFKTQDLRIKNKKGYFFVQGREGIILKRLSRGRFSKNKLRIAERAGGILLRIPSIKFVGITGALAMKNADEDSDIDFLIVTSNGSLWTTRLVAFLSLKISGFKLRCANDKNQKDKLCLNVWLDESDLVFRKRNIFTAHEIAQIIPVINKDKTYEKLLRKNKWVLDYWPRAVARKYLASSSKYQVSKKSLIHNTLSLLPNTVIERIAYKLQYCYMKSKITRETITKTRAIFHPYDWSATVLKRL